MVRPNWVSCLATVAVLALSLAGRFLEAQAPILNGPPSVDLKCRIIGHPEGPPIYFWLVELRNTAGRTLRKVMGAAGETVRFKNLPPGFYRIFVSGKGRSRNEFIDLSMAPNQNFQEFVKEIRIPEFPSGQKDRVQVSVRALAIPKDAFQELKQSEKYQAEGKAEKAIEHLKRAVEIYPAYADAWNNLGACYHNQQKYDLAIRSFKQATILNPEKYIGWLNLGSSLIASEKLAEAIEATGKAHALEPDDAAVNVQMGKAYYYFHDYTKAQKYLRRATEIDPAFMPSPHLFLAQIALIQKDYPAAASSWRTYLELHPNGSDAAYARLMLAHYSQ
jgi:tetratricopeptide (TPR) repeat protein